MNLWDHLGELRRRRLLICIYVLLAGLPVGGFLVNPIIAWLSKPVGELVFVQPMEAFTAQLEIAVGVSFLLGLPVLLYQAWSFIGAGLKRKGKRLFSLGNPCGLYRFYDRRGFFRLLGISAGGFVSFNSQIAAFGAHAFRRVLSQVLYDAVPGFRNPFQLAARRCTSWPKWES